MPAIDTTNFIFPVLIVAAAALAAVLLSLAVKRARAAADRRILDSYGRRGEPEDGAAEDASAYHSYFARAHPDGRRIDQTTWSDLNMDDVWGRVGACRSSVGEEYLYHILHETSCGPAELERRERLASWMDAHPTERLTIQKILMGIGKRGGNRLSYYLFHADAKKMRFARLYTLMAILPLAGLALVPFAAAAGVALALCAIAVNIVTYYVNCQLMESELDSMRYFSALVHGGKALLRRAGGEMRELGIDIASAVKPFSRARGLLPGRAQQGLAELEVLTVLFKAFFLADLVSYNGTVRKITKHMDAFRRLFEAVGEIDAAIAVASFRRSLPYYCTPTFHTQNEVAFSGLFHPLLREPVANSARIANDSIVTGSNASGKSTFIKTIAVNAILAQTIHTCCARRYAQTCAYVATSMALRDDILSGESYFVTEVKSLRRIMEYCKGGRCLCFIDEILRGTNTPERIAASTAVLRWLHQTDSLCVVASHDIELTEILQGSFDNYHFSEAFDGDGIVFDYVLKDGPSDSTNAIRLLEYMGFEPEVVREASALVQKKGRE